MTQTLKLTHPMMNGPAIKRLQEAGDVFGFDTGTNDGVFGKDTERAVKHMQKKFGLPADGVCGPATWDAIEKNWPGCSSQDNADTEPKIEHEGVVDLRGKHARPKLLNKKNPKRTWSTITGVTLHQTGCMLSNNPARWKTLNAHIGITRDGKFIVANDPTDYIWHAQGLSKHTIGIEICGSFQGIDGNDCTRWKEGGGPDHLTLEMEQALNRAFDWILAEFKTNNQIWQHVYAHRQSKSTRTADPGSEIWNKIAQLWIARIGGSDGGPDWKKGSGKPIPKEWNSKYSNHY